MSKSANQLEQEAVEHTRRRRIWTEGLGQLLGRTGSNQPLRRSAKDVIENPEVSQDFHRGFKQGQQQRERGS